MLANTLPSGTVRNAAASAVEFARLSISERETVFAQVSEAPNRPNRLKIKHQESGSGFNLRRRSVIRFDKSAASDVDTTKVVTSSAYVVLDTPVGAFTTTAEAKAVLAYLSGFLASVGTSTLLYDGTGNGQVALLDGSL